MQIQEMVVFVTGTNRGLDRGFACAAVALGAKKVYAAARAPARILRALEAGDEEISTSNPPPGRLS